MSARTAAPRALVAALVALLLTAGAVGGLPSGTARADSAPLDPANPATPLTVAADALPTVQINGVVWSQVVVGNTVYVAGQFTRARPAGAAPGTQETVRNNLLAYDIRTGQLITSFAPSLNAQALVVTASPDGSRIYVGGDFSQANGQTRNRVAAYSTATGGLIPDFRPNVSSRVAAIAATGSTVYLGGTFTAVGSVSRHRLAAVSASSGALLPWNPIPGPGPVLNRDGSTGTSDVVKALVLTHGGAQVVVGGHFDTLNGVKATGVGALDAASGATRPFAINQILTNQGTNSAITSLTTDGVNVYGTAYDYYGPGNLEGGFAARADGGAVHWINECHGDTYSNFPTGGALYLAGHPHVCSNIGGFHEHSPRIHRYATAVSLAATGTVGTGTLCGSRIAADGTVVHRNSTGACSGTLLQGKPAPALSTWFPTMAMGSYTGQYQSGWSVAGNADYVVYGGEFPRVNGVEQQGLVRYAVPTIAPNRIGPAAGGLDAAVSAPVDGMARVTWATTNDRDNEHLTYRVYRDGDNRNPVHEVTRSSIWWDPRPMAFADVGVPAGTHTYRVSAFDAMGNRADSPWMSIDVTAGSIEPRGYSDVVHSDGPQHYWPLGEDGGSRAVDHAGGGDLAVRAGVGGATPERGVAGAISGDDDTAYRFLGQTSGSGLGHASTQSAVAAPNTFSVEAWFRTTSTAGGKIIGFGNAATGNSTSYDRHVYMDTSGRVLFGVHAGAPRTVGSDESYNDGRWHHVVASMNRSGMALYLDGELVGSRTDTTSGAAYSGYWRVGGDTSWSGAAYFAGDVDEAAVYPVAMQADRVADHHAVGSTGEPANLEPAAVFTSEVSDLAASFDGTASSDPDGTVESHAWDFGDGTTGTGATATHAYAAAGTYPVTLTVTDDDGATASTTQSVTVTAPLPNAAPTASFTATGAGLTVSVDGSASTDSDGSVASFAWDFGDGATATGATATHGYAAAGTYPVTLTVTDDDGATGTAEQSVTVTTVTVLASDTFQRTVTGGLGTADTGGTWTVSAGGTRQSVTPGAAELNLTPGTNTGSFLSGVSQTSADLRTAFSLSAVPTGGGAFVYVPTRRVGTNQEYRARVRILADGSVRVAFTRLSGTAGETVIGGEQVIAGLRYTAGTVLRVRTLVDGTGTTELSATVWADGTPEPAEPTVTRTDSTASLQAAGSVGLTGYLSGSATAAVRARFTGLTVVPVGAAEPAPEPEPEPEPEQPPTAEFTATVTGLGVSVDGSASADSDGSIATHAWDFGDGTTASGATASHTYAAAGTYTVTLTVTDDGGATGTASEPVTVTAPEVPDDGEEPVDPAALVTDTFDRTVTGGLGTADVGGDWTVQFGGARQSVGAGAATLNLGAGGHNTGSFLGAVSGLDVDVQAGLVVDQAPTGGGTFVYVAARRVSETGLYRARLRFLTDGTVRVALTRLSGSFSEAVIGGEVVVPGVSSAPGTPLNIRLTVQGTGSTELSATVWAEGTAEPAEPTVTRTDTTAALQVPGAVGLSAYLSGSATAPVAVRFTGLTVRAIG